jgi:hypothetical protein
MKGPLSSSLIQRQSLLLLLRTPYTVSGISPNNTDNEVALIGGGTGMSVSLFPLPSTNPLLQ